MERANIIWLILALLPSNPSARIILALLLMVANFSACVHSSRYRSRCTVSCSPQTSPVLIQWLIYGSSMAHLGSSWLIVALLLSALLIHLLRALIYCSSIAHLSLICGAIA
jgi:hypothetical protein